MQDTTTVTSAIIPEDRGQHAEDSLDGIMTDHEERSVMIGDERFHQLPGDSPGPNVPSQEVPAPVLKKGGHDLVATVEKYADVRDGVVFCSEQGHDTLLERGFKSLSINIINVKNKKL